jgi:hypothetical protein
MISVKRRCRSSKHEAANLETMIRIGIRKRGPYFATW